MFWCIAFCGWLKRQLKLKLAFSLYLLVILIFFFCTCWEIQYPLFCCRLFGRTTTNGTSMLKTPATCKASMLRNTGDGHLHFAPFVSFQKASNGMLMETEYRGKRAHLLYSFRADLLLSQKRKSRGHALSYQVAYSQHMFELLSHRIVFHGHEDSVENNADGDSQINKGVQDNELHKPFQFHPQWATVPHKEFMSKLVPPWWALLMCLFQFWKQKSRMTKTAAIIIIIVKIKVT